MDLKTQGLFWCSSTAFALSVYFCGADAANNASPRALRELYMYIVRFNQPEAQKEEGATEALAAAQQQGRGTDWRTAQRRVGTGQADPPQAESGQAAPLAEARQGREGQARAGR